MKKLSLILVTLFVLFATTAMAASNVTIYRYQAKDIKTLPANLIMGSTKTIDPWVQDGAKWPVGKKIALLLHGYPIFSDGKCRDGLIGLAAHLSVARNVGNVALPAYDNIYTVEYPLKQHVLETAAQLADIVNSRCPSGSKIDIFAHSMGGLVARTAIEYPEVLLGTKKISDRVSHLVLMGTPSNGIGSPEIDIFKQVMDPLPPEIADMDSGCMFMVMLNFTSEKKPKVSCDYYSIVGARSYRPEKYTKGKTGLFATVLKKLQDQISPVHDGLIDATSAGYDLSSVCRSFKKVQLDLNHDYIKMHPEVYTAIDNWMIEDKWFGTTSESTENSQPKPTQSKSKGGFLGRLSDQLKKIKLPRISGIKLPDILSPTPGQAKVETSKQSDTAEEDVVTSGTGYLRLIGLDFNGVISRIGLQPDQTWGNSGGVVSTVVLGWNFQNKPLPGYNIYVHFDHYRNRGSTETLKIVHFVNTVNQKLDMAVPPQKIVPADVLSSKPQMIFWLNDAYQSNDIAVVWLKDGYTYCLGLGDTRRKLVENRQAVDSSGVLVSSRYLTPAGENFRSCNQALFFVCVDREIVIFPQKGSLEYYQDGRGFIKYDPTGGLVYKFDN